MFHSLESAGLLSALVFVTSVLFEFAEIQQLYTSQHPLIVLLLTVLSAWAIVEASLCNIKLLHKWSLLGLLGTQIGINASRHFHGSANFLFAANQIQTPLTSLNPYSSAFFLGTNLVLFIAISRIVIHAFASLERLRADQLAAKNSELLQIQEEIIQTKENQERKDQLLRYQLEQKLKTSLTAAAVVHEIQQPLSSILINCQNADSWLDGVSANLQTEKLLACLSQLKSNGEQVTRTMERMRMLLRNVETEHSEIDLTSHLNNSLLYLKTELSRSQTNIEIKGLNSPCPIIGDGAQIQIAFVNLVRNALQAMEYQLPRSRQLLIQLQRRSSSVALHVADSGPGFPTDFIHDTSWELLKSTKASGMGIGLFIAKTATSNHNGELHIKTCSTLGGAEVVIDLPLKMESSPHRDVPSFSQLDNRSNTGQEGGMKA